jgi:ketosteroid isomerase-like protein
MAEPVSGRATAVVRALYATWNESGPDAFVARLHPDIRWRAIDVDGTQRTFRGRDEVRALLGRLMEAWGEARILPERFDEVGHDVVVPIALHPRAAEDGSVAPGGLDLTEVWTLDGGELVGYRAYLSREPALAGARRRAAATGPQPPGGPRRLRPALRPIARRGPRPAPEP